MTDDETTSRAVECVRAGVALTVLIVLMAGSAPALAQQGGGVINLDETVIEGNIQKPEAFYILQPSNLKYRELRPKKSFIPELMQTVDREPIESTQPTDGSGDQSQQ